MLAFGDRIFTRGASRRNLLLVGLAITAVFWAYSSLLYLNVISFPWPFPKWYAGTDWMLNSGLPLGLTRSTIADVLGFAIFASYPLWFFLGTELAKAGGHLTKARRIEERNRIIQELARTEYPRGGAIEPGADDVGTAGWMVTLLGRMPKMFSDGLTILFFTFDSRFFVLVFTGKWSRFVNLDADPKATWEKRKYLEVWESNRFLASISQILRIAASYGYYTRPEVYKSIGYGGPMAPNPPPWYVPSPIASPASALPPKTPATARRRKK